MSSSVSADNSSGYDAFQATRHFGSLDGLRCLSIVAVIWHHGPGGSMDGIGGRGYVGVTLFFAISGFLITTLLLREKSRTGRIAMRKFYFRRTLRIFPLYYAILGIYVVMMSFAASSAAQSALFYANVPYFLTYTSNWFVGTQGTFSFAWSLAAEEQFYASWPWVVQRFDRNKAAYLISTVLVVVIVWRFFGTLPVNPPFALVVLDNIPMAICWGSLAACLLDSRRGFAAVQAVLGHRWAPVGSLAAALYLLQTLERAHNPWTHFFLAALVVSCVIREDHVLAPLLRMRALVQVGIVSYGMYLMNMLVYVAQGRGEAAGFIPWDAQGMIGFAVTLFTVYLTAALSFRFYEAPFLKLKSRFSV